MNKFIYTKNTSIYDEFDNVLLLEGVGLGGWMLPEGYMWGNHKYYERPRRFEELVRLYFNEEESFDFWKTYHENWISDKDFELIKNHGYNSIRLPINFRLIMDENEETSDVVFNEYGFKMIDYTIQQCKKHHLYLILDLHGAPGGQTGANIDDSKYDKPELFTKEIYQDQVVTLWREIANRYKDEKIIAMYDLLNEPLPKWNNKLNDKLEPLHKRITKAIREVDQNHLISIEGANWATDFSVITERFDEKLVLHFHKYWSPVSIDTIQEFIDKSNELNLPLIMGEGGENDLYWYSGAFKMYQQLNIGWNFWAYKKRENHNSVISFDLPEDWKTIFRKDQPLEKELGRKLLTEFLENIKFKHCKINKDVSNHLLNKDEFHTVGSMYDYNENAFLVSKPLCDPTIRIDDRTCITDRDGNPYIGYYHCLSDEEIKNERYPFLKGSKGDFYNYSFKISKKALNKPFNISVTHNKLLCEVALNGIKVDFNDTGNIINLSSVLTRENNVLTIYPLNEGIIKFIMFH